MLCVCHNQWFFCQSTILQTIQLSVRLFMFIFSYRYIFRFSRLRCGAGGSHEKRNAGPGAARGAAPRRVVRTVCAVSTRRLAHKRNAGRRAALRCAYEDTVGLVCRRSAPHRGTSWAPLQCAHNGFAFGEIRPWHTIPSGSKLVES